MGVPEVISASEQVCVDVSHERAQQARQVMDASARQAAAAEAERQALTADSGQAYESQMAASQADLAPRRSIAANAYNPPADMIAPYTAAQPGNQGDATERSEAPAQGAERIVYDNSQRGGQEAAPQDPLNATLSRLNQDLHSAEAANRASPFRPSTSTAVWRRRLAAAGHAAGRRRPETIAVRTHTQVRLHSPIRRPRYPPTTTARQSLRTTTAAPLSVKTTYRPAAILPMTMATARAAAERIRVNTNRRCA